MVKSQQLEERVPCSESDLMTGGDQSSNLRGKVFEVFIEFRSNSQCCNEVPAQTSDTSLACVRKASPLRKTSQKIDYGTFDPEDQRFSRFFPFFSPLYSEILRYCGL